MTTEEIQSVYRRLTEALQAYQLDWIVKEVDEQIQFGKTEKKEVETVRELVVDSNIPSRQSFRSGPKAFFNATRPYNPSECLSLLIDAIEQAVINTAGMENSLTDSLRELDGPGQGILVREELGRQPMEINPSAASIRNLHASKLKNLLEELRREI